MNIKDKETSKRYPFWRVVTGVVGILASSISLILMYKSVSTSLTIGLILSLVFFIVFIFSPLLAFLITSTITVPFSSWLMPSQWINILLFLGGTAYIIYDDKSGLREWLEKHYSSQRKPKLNLLKYDQRSELYKTLSFIFLLTTWLVPYIGVVTLGLSILIPLLTVIRSFRYPRIIPFGSQNKRSLTPIASALLIPGLFMCLCIINSQEYTYTVWLYSGIFASFWIILFLVFNQEYKEKITVALGFIVCIAIFSFGAVCNVNREYDFHTPNQYIETVTDKHISSGKSQLSYVTVTPWPDKQDNTEIQIDRQTFEKIGIGQKVYIVTYPGALGIGWYGLSLYPVNLQPRTPFS
jgi:hypothetical protein